MISIFSRVPKESKDYSVPLALLDHSDSPEPREWEERLALLDLLERLDLQVLTADLVPLEERVLLVKLVRLDLMDHKDLMEMLEILDLLDLLDQLEKE